MFIVADLVSLNHETCEIPLLYVIKSYIMQVMSCLRKYHCANHKASFKVKKVAKIRNQYKQVPRLTKDTTWESDINKIKHQKPKPRVNPFQAGDQKAAMNRRKSMTNARHK